MGRVTLRFWVAIFIFDLRMVNIEPELVCGFASLLNNSYLHPNSLLSFASFINHFVHIQVDGSFSNELI